MWNAKELVLVRINKDKLRFLQCSKSVIAQIGINLVKDAHFWKAPESVDNFFYLWTFSSMESAETGRVYRWPPGHQDRFWTVGPQYVWPWWTEHRRRTAANIQCLVIKLRPLSASCTRRGASVLGGTAMVSIRRCRVHLSHVVFSLKSVTELHPNGFR